MLKRATVCAALMAALAVVDASAQGHAAAPPGRARNGLHEVNARAIDARSNGVGPVRQLTDTIIDRTCPVDLPASHSVRARVFRAELRFRTSRDAASIPETQAVDAMNALVDAVGAPAWARTSVDQVHLFRTALKPHVPQLIDSEPAGPTPFAITDRLSPAEAVLVTCSLANGKLFNPDYQIDPAAWVEQVHQERLRRAQNRSVLPERPPGRLEIRLERPDVTAGLRSLEAGLSDEASEETRQAHRFLDRLGVGK